MSTLPKETIAASSNVGERLHSVDFLRGIASLGVCYLHLTFSLPPSWLGSSGYYGRLGVEIFFVISGFIIPYSLYKGGYRLRNYGTFMLKRMIRLDPPYLIAIALIVPLGYLSAAMPGFRGPPYHVSTSQLLLHFAYLNAFFSSNWLNPVFWTLAIEFQFYLLLGLLFPLILHRSPAVRYLLFAALAALAVVSSSKYYEGCVFHWLFLFAQGMIAFLWFKRLVTTWEYCLLSLILFGGASYTLGPLIAVTGISTACLILLIGGSNKIMLFFGNISYSLYLIHNPTGVKVVNLGIRFANNWVGYLGLLIAGMVVSIAAAYALYYFVEKPARKWSSAIFYKNKLRKAPGD
jgi:peptidoglycan/LPS O-acetylase OafA/YrhL